LPPASGYVQSEKNDYIAQLLKMEAASYSETKLISIPDDRQF